MAEDDGATHTKPLGIPLARHRRCRRRGRRRRDVTVRIIVTDVIIAETRRRHTSCVARAERSLTIISWTTPTIYARSPGADASSRDPGQWSGDVRSPDGNWSFNSVESDSIISEYGAQSKCENRAIGSSIFITLNVQETYLKWVYIRSPRPRLITTSEIITALFQRAPLNTETSVIYFIRGLEHNLCDRALKARKHDDAGASRRARVFASASSSRLARAAYHI